MSEEQAQQLLYQMQMLEGYLSELSQKEATIISASLEQGKQQMEQMLAASRSKK